MDFRIFPSSGLACMCEGIHARILGQGLENAGGRGGYRAKRRGGYRAARKAVTSMQAWAEEARVGAGVVFVRDYLVASGMMVIERSPTPHGVEQEALTA